MKAKAISIIMGICFIIMIISVGCKSHTEDSGTALDLTSPEKTMDLCMSAIEEADNKQLNRISLIHYAEMQKDMGEESEEVRKAYYTDCAAKEMKDACYESTIKQLSSLYGGVEFLEPQRIVGGNGQEVCYKVDAVGTEYSVDEKAMDLDRKSVV